LARKRLVNALFAMMIGLAFFPAAVTGLFAMQKLQERQFPIITEFMVRSAERRDDGALILGGTLNKRYGWCVYDQAQWYAVGDDGVQHRIGWDSIEQPRLANTGSSRPAGRQSFGPWAVYVQGFPEARELWLVIDHVCLAFWPTRTILGPVRPPAAG
jgi:hypothetical protein